MENGGKRGGKYQCRKGHTSLSHLAWIDNGLRCPCYILAHTYVCVRECERARERERERERESESESESESKRERERERERDRERARARAREKRERESTFRGIVRPQR